MVSKICCGFLFPIRVDVLIISRLETEVKIRRHLVNFLYNKVSVIPRPAERGKGHIAPCLRGASKAMK